MTRLGSRGAPVVMLSTDRKSAFLQGSTTDSTTKIARPWVDRVELATGTRTRIYEGKGDVTETISAPLDDDFATAMIQRESPTAVPQSYLLTLATKDASSSPGIDELMPEIRNAIKKTVTARRADGYTFRVKVTLPADWKEGTRLPAMFWFYPSEYATQEAYNRGTAAAGDPPTRFPDLRCRARSSFLTTVGYAVDRAGCADLRVRGAAAERQLRRRPPQQPGGDDRRARFARLHRSASPRHRRPLVRRLLDRQRDGAHAVLQGRHRR